MDQPMDQVLQNRYRLQSLLGRQTGRRSFLASDLQTDAPVVVKLLLFGPDFTWDDLKLFEREAEVLKTLDHPAIPRYLDSFEVETALGKGFALVQTYIEARSLQDWVQAGRSFSETDLTTIAKALLDILSYLHRRQPAVIHRDIKPSNILLSDRSGHSPGQVYLIDFGSVQTAVQGGTRTIVGTYGYMPPEQFGGRALPASDLYALGATLIYLATGQHPDQLPQRELRIEFADQVALSPGLIDWLQWLTDPRLEARPQSAQRALEALEQPSVPARLATVKPAGSKVQLTQSRELLEVEIPPMGFHLELIVIIGFALAWNAFLIVWYAIAVATWSGGGWIGALFALGHLGVGLFLVWSILFTLFGTVKLRITPSEILLTQSLLGVRCAPSLKADRQAIVKLELTRLSYRNDSDKGVIEVPPQINIWAGTRKFTLGGKNNTGKDTLTPPELEWLAQDLSQWLKLPVTRD
ncbi:MAG: serine/threonine protein kinase [Elainella sp.]